MVPWPRTVINFPIILIAIVQQFLTAVALVWDPQAHYATSIHILYEVLPNSKVLAGFLFMSAFMAGASFSMRRKVETIMLMVPQQLMLYLCAGAALHAIAIGEFADGTQRSSAFLLADQVPIILLAVFHTWAMVLILIHGEEIKQ